jgi:hypothetical protein
VTGSNLNQKVQHFLNLELDLWFSSALRLNLELNFGLVQQVQGSNFGSELNHSIPNMVKE